MTVCRMIQPETLEEALEALAGERATMMVSYFIMEANNNNLSIHTGETGASSMYSISFFQISCCNGIDSFRIESILAQAWLSNSRSPGWSMNIIRCQSYSAAMYCISSFC